MQPSDPWHSSSLPQKGDADAISTYAGVGRVLSQWEEVEVELSAIYTILRGKHRQLAAFHEYGLGRIFADRVQIFEKAMEAFFIKRPNQQLEGEMFVILQRVKNLANRRNEVAHGLVRPIQWMRSRRADDPPGGQFVLVPSHYNKRKFTPKTLPTYAYTSIELHAVEMALFDARTALADYSLALGALLNL